MEFNEKDFEKELFQYFDHIKEFLSPDIWQNILRDCSKNELFVMWLLYRNHEVNMTQIAEYIHVPLNTATGIVSRMEKKKLVCRERSLEDKRIVTIRLGEYGINQIKSVLKEFIFYGKKVLEAFSTEEMELLFRMMNKLADIMKEEHHRNTTKLKVRKIVID